MNNVNCNIIKDILPLYIDNLISEDTRKFVENHIQNCDECRKELSLLKTDLNVPEAIINEQDGVAILKKLRLDIRKKRVFTGILSAIIVILSFAYLTAPEYLPYTESLEIAAAKENNGSVTLSFTGEYELSQRAQGVYGISLYDTIWNKLFNTEKKQTIIVNPNGEAVNTIYYVSNGGQEDKVIYGENPIYNGGVMTLPRLFLNYYITLDILIALVLAVFFLMFRKKEKVKAIIVKMLFVLVSYFVSHVMITGFNATSYSATRDFCLILLLAIPIYFIAYIFYEKKKNS